MKLNLIIAAAALLGHAESKSDPINLRLMTYNIRLAVGTAGAGEEKWSVREPLMASQLNYETQGRPESLLCFQEALPTQVDDLANALGAEWSYFGVGRDDGQRQGEFSPIFYRSEVWKLEESKTYWLSPTPEEPGSKGWDAALPRIVTVARLRHDGSGARLVYMCTHFDHIGQVARENSAKLIVKLADEWSTHKKKTIPVFLGGDLNVTPDNEAYKTLASEMNDVKKITPERLVFGNDNTYTAFTTDTGDDSQLDHIFVKDPEGLEWGAHAVLNTRFDDNIFISDHRPVVVDVKMPSKQSKD